MGAADPVALYPRRADGSKRAAAVMMLLSAAFADPVRDCQARRMP